jgi:GTP-binding protein EngB required for normal cell division
VEFHPRIDSLASRLEDNNLEVALFGRVSCGKSSLLNALLDTNVLPVGVTPITAVPTRLQYGTTLRASVTYFHGHTEFVTVQELGKLVTEQGNPGNLHNVARAMVEVPSQRLKPGIVLVDTPGLGSLARRGAQESLAYLPSCDLALLLIDAGATLNEEDIGTVRLLYEAAVPAIVLLSKADLLAEGDLFRVANYIHEQLQQELGVTVKVHPVSSQPQQTVLLEHFFEQELLPRFNQARILHGSSAARRIGAMRDAVITAFETTLDQRNRRGRGFPADVHDLEERLRVVSGEVGELRTVLDRAFFILAETPETILNHTVESVWAWMRSSSTARVPSTQLSEWLHSAVQNSLVQILENARSTSRRAIDRIRTVAQEMGRSDLPEHDEVEALFRGMPRFELGMLPDEMNLAVWRIFGRGVVGARVRSSLRNSIGATLKQTLHLYGQALSQWGHQFTNSMVLLTSSHADAYRVQLQRIDGTSNDKIDLLQLERDLAVLRNWTAKESNGEMVHHE